MGENIVSLWIMKEEVKNTDGDRIRWLNALHYCIIVFSESQFNSYLLILVNMKLAGSFS